MGGNDGVHRVGDRHLGDGIQLDADVDALAPMDSCDTRLFLNKL